MKHIVWKRLTIILQKRYLIFEKIINQGSPRTRSAHCFRSTIIFKLYSQQSRKAMVTIQREVRSVFLELFSDFTVIYNEQLEAAKFTH